MAARHTILSAVAIWLATRLLLLLATLATGLDSWQFWDAHFYHAIAEHGYPATDWLLPAYFPLYPALMRLAMTALSWQFAGLMISNLALLAALILVGRLAGPYALWAMLALACLPSSFFLSGLYADALFVTLTLAVLALAQRDYWLAASLPLAAAAVTRPFGVALCLAVWLAYALRRRYRLAEFLALVGVPALAFLNWLLYLALIYQDPLAFAHSEQSVFGRSLAWPWQTLWLQAQQLLAVRTPLLLLHMLLDLVPLAVCAIVLATHYRRWPPLYSLLTAAVLLLCLLTPVTAAAGQYALISAGRYTFAAVPVLLVLGQRLQALPRPAAIALLSVGLAFQLGLTVYVLHGGWIV
jgi:hypothetical protein